jgi:hypothetical protein
MAHSATAAAAPRKSIETARRSGPGLNVSFVFLIAFIFLWVSEIRREPNCFYLPFIFEHLTETTGQPNQLASR